MSGQRSKLAADLAAFATRIGHDFQRPELLARAVTHASLSSPTRPSNERPVSSRKRLKYLICTGSALV